MDRLYPPNPEIWRFPPSFSENEIRLIRKLPGHEADSSVDLAFVATKHGDGYITVDIARTSYVFDKDGDPVRNYNRWEKAVLDGGERVYSPELVAKDLYPQMFDYFEAQAKASNWPIKGIKGHFALENGRDIFKAVEKDPALVVKELPSGEKHLSTKALKASKTWKYWEQYADDYGYNLRSKEPVSMIVDDEGGKHVFWEFELVKRKGGKGLVIVAPFALAHDDGEGDQRDQKDQEK
jgi:hypothetical protein